MTSQLNLAPELTCNPAPPNFKDLFRFTKHTQKMLTKLFQNECILIPIWQRAS